jgi:sodium pump decarboxylase gamma subunit
MDYLAILKAGGGVFLFGFSIVFVCLILLIAYIALQSKLINREKKPSKQNKNKSVAKPSNDFIGQIVLDDKKEIAAIAGALAVYLGTDAGNLVIKSYRRIGSAAPAWRRAGHRDQLFNKF